MLLIEKIYRYKVSIIFSILITLVLFGLGLLSLLFFDFSINFSLRSILIALFFYFLLFILITFLSDFLIKKYVNSKLTELYEDLNSTGISINMENVKNDSKELSRQIQRFADDRNIKIRLLEQKENFRKEFIGNLAHELKTPLFTVQGYIHTILDGIAKDEKTINKYLIKASKGIKRLDEIIKDLDSISKMESGDSSLKLTKFNIVSLIKKEMELLESQALKKKIILIFDNNKFIQKNVLADEEGIKKILTNLIFNSLKYGVFNGTTEIKLEDISDLKILIRIIDNGKGIDKDNLPRIFERFYRIDTNRSRIEGGSGLGLAIVKHIIEAHNEKIYVESTIGVGSEFSFTLQKAN